jgi:hypothetical protein
MNEATTDPFSDYAELLEPRPKFWQVYNALLEHWKKCKFFYDLSVVAVPSRGRKIVMFKVKLETPSNDDRFDHQYPSIYYKTELAQRINPHDGLHTWYISRERSDNLNIYARDILQREDSEFVVGCRATVLRGVDVGDTRIWTCSTVGLDKIVSVKDAIEASKRMKDELLGEETEDE